MKRAEKKALEAQARAKATMQRKALMKAVSVLVALALAFVALPMLLMSLVVAAVLLRWPDRFYGRLAAVLGLIPSVGGLLLLGGYWEAYTAIWAGEVTFGNVLTCLVFAVAFAPLLGSLAARVWRTRREAAPLAGPAEVTRREELEDARRTSTAQTVQKWAHLPGEGRMGTARQVLAKQQSISAGEKRGPYLGRYLRGDLGDGWRSKRGKSALFPVKAVPYPSVTVLGSSGTGKSETVMRLAEWAQEQEQESQVIYLNAKEAAPGSEPSRRLLAHAEALGKDARVLVPSVSPYDFMRGSPTEIRHRLMDVELFSEPHHEAGTAVTLAFGLHKLATEGRPAGALVDVLRELVDRKRVAQWAAHDPFAARLLEMVDERSWSGTVQRYSANAMDLVGWTGPASAGGWGLEDASLICMDLPTSSEYRSARMMLRLALADLEAYLTSDRRRRTSTGEFAPLTVVLEELSALDTDPVIGRKITNLMERMRTSGARAVVVAQDLGGVGDERAMNALVNNTTLLTHRQSNEYVETVAAAAGTRERPEASGTYDGSWNAIRRARSGSVRMQEQYAVHPNEIRNLRRGEMFVIAGGRYMKVAGTMGGHGYGVPETDQVRALDQARITSRRARATETGMVSDQEEVKVGEVEL